MKCNNWVVYRDAKNGSSRKVPYMWFHPSALADGTVTELPEGAKKCEAGTVKVTGMSAFSTGDDEVHIDIRYACDKCQAPHFPELPQKLTDLIPVLQKHLDSLA